MIHISESNSKIGKIHSFSTLPGDASHLITIAGTTTELSLVPGTCSGVCSGCFGKCYAVKFIKRYGDTTVKALEDNTLALRDGSYFDAVQTYLRNNKVTIFRWNVSGEIESYDQFISMNSIAWMFPNIKFYVYTKRYDLVGRFFEEYGDTQDNLTINISQWMGMADAFIKKYKDRNYKFNVFDYDPSYRELKNDNSLEANVRKMVYAMRHHCPSVDKNGKHNFITVNGARTQVTCDMCKRCIDKTNEVTCVYSH